MDLNSRGGTGREEYLHAAGEYKLVNELKGISLQGLRSLPYYKTLRLKFHRIYMRARPERRRRDASQAIRIKKLALLIPSRLSMPAATVAPNYGMTSGSFCAILADALPDGLLVV
jgi:hypothetical protein